MHPVLFQFGRVLLPTYGFLVALGAILAVVVCTRTARLLSLDTDKVISVVGYSVVTATAGYKLVSFLCKLPRYGGSVALAIAIAVGFVYAKVRRLPMRRTADAVAPALALAASVIAMGCLEAGCDYGAPTRVPWAIIFHSRAAMPGTPLEVPLHPTQIYASLIDFLLFVWLFWRLHRPHRDGDILGTWLFFSGLSIFLLAFLRGDSVWLAGLMTLSQLLACAMVLGGAALWLRDA